MGLYVEVMCDLHLEWPDHPEFTGRLNHRCWSDRNDNPQGHTVGTARKEARRQGWYISGNEAVCPGCMRQV